MELAYLKKHTRAHKYRDKLSNSEIEKTLEGHVSSLKKLSIFNSKLVPPEVRDEYWEEVADVVSKARMDLQNQFQSKIRITPSQSNFLAIKIYLASI
jgi:hypothetical protein